MRFIKKQLSLWRMVLIIGAAAIAIPIAVRVSPTALAVHKERHDYLPVQTSVENEEAAVGEGVARQDDDYYDRRREYWEKRVERRLDDEDLDEQTVDDNDADAKDSKADKDEGDDDDDSVDQEVERIERRREYWRQRLDKEW